MAALIPSASATGSGTMTLAGPSTNSNQTITIPDATGTMMVSGNMPAFSAYLASNQTLSSNTWTKLQINTEEFDTNNNYDSATNYRFTPTVTGYYQFSCGVSALNGANTAISTSIYKNGSATKTTICYSSTANGLDDWSGSISAIIYMNGSTDYVELYANLVGATLTINAGSATTWFSGVLVRGA
jgi:hypothetical protein